MENIIVLYGGKSVEHDISIITALQAIENLDKQKYDIYKIYITKQGEFISPTSATKPQDYITEINKYKKVKFCFGKGIVSIGAKKIKIDCILNCMHGTNGEDGVASALARLLPCPITCPDVMSSAVCMDKVIMKDIMRANNLLCVDYISFLKHEYQNDEAKIITNAEKLGYPLIVKPANLGSSIGIEVAKTREELDYAISVALNYDNKIIVEKCLTEMIEINCACLGNSLCCETSLLEKPSSWNAFLDFKDKYISNQKETNNRFDFELDSNLEKQIHEISKKAYKVFGCSGVIRIDFMIDSKNNIYINELNTVPGSLAFYLFKHKYSYRQLLDRIIELSKQDYNNKQLNIYTFNSDVLQKNKGFK